LAAEEIDQDNNTCPNLFSFEGDDSNRILDLGYDVDGWLNNMK